VAADGPCRHILAGLARGSYRVLHNGRPLLQLQTPSANGVLAFQAEGGGRYEVVR
jgi:hypothetical protein